MNDFITHLQGLWSSHLQHPGLRSNVVAHLRVCSIIKSDTQFCLYNITSRWDWYTNSILSLTLNYGYSTPLRLVNMLLFKSYSWINEVVI
jgi:hypothetical protein